MTAEDWVKFHNDVDDCDGVCPGCGKKGDPTKMVPDHGHNVVPGESVYREPLCQRCNFDKRINFRIVVLAHNGGGYDWIRLQDEISRLLPDSHCECAMCAGCECEDECDCERKPYQWRIGSVLGKTMQKWLSFGMYCTQPTELPRCIVVTKDNRCERFASVGHQLCCKHKKHKGAINSTPDVVAHSKRVTVELKFFDTLNFMKDSLDTLAKKLIPDEIEQRWRKEGLDTLVGQRHSVAENVVANVQRGVPS